MTTNESTSKDGYVKGVTFNGKKRDWSPWEEKFLARAKRKGHQRTVDSMWRINSRSIPGMGPGIDSTHGIDSRIAIIAIMSTRDYPRNKDPVGVFYFSTYFFCRIHGPSYFAASALLPVSSVIYF